jgi:hypothetical protein
MTKTQKWIIKERAKEAAEKERRFSKIKGIEGLKTSVLRNISAIQDRVEKLNGHGDLDAQQTKAHHLIIRYSKLLLQIDKKLERLKKP